MVRVSMSFRQSSLPFVSISCGGTSKVTVLKSTFMKLSMQGRTKNKPGPLAPPDLTKPRRMMTALSYSLTIYEKNKKTHVIFSYRQAWKIKIKAYLNTHKDADRQCHQE